jgi:hypothetical protein
MESLFTVCTAPKEMAVPRGVGRPGQRDALDALWGTIREYHPCVRRREMGQATTAVILAITESSRTPREVILSPEFGKADPGRSIDSDKDVTLR